MDYRNSVDSLRSDLRAEQESLAVDRRSTLASLKRLVADIEADMGRDETPRIGGVPRVHFSRFVTSCTSRSIFPCFRLYNAPGI